MEARSTDKKTFQVTDNGTLLGELVYENLFFLKAEIKLNDSEVYRIAPVGFFGTSINVTRDGNEVAIMVMNWRGQIVFTFQDGQEFILKLNGFFTNKYVVENKDGEKLVQLEAKFDWRKFQYQYDITYNMVQDQKLQDTLLLLLGVYAANYFISSMSGASAGMM